MCVYICTLVAFGNQLVSFQNEYAWWGTDLLMNDSSLLRLKEEMWSKIPKT